MRCGRAGREGGAGILRHGWRAHCTLRARIKGEARAGSPAPPLPAQLVGAAHRRRRRASGAIRMFAGIDAAGPIRSCRIHHGRRGGGGGTCLRRHAGGRTPDAQGGELFGPADARFFRAAGRARARQTPSADSRFSALPALCELSPLVSSRNFPRAPRRFARTRG